MNRLNRNLQNLKKKFKCSFLGLTIYNFDVISFIFYYIPLRLKNNQQQMQKEGIFDAQLIMKNMILFFFEMAQVIHK
jgi:hypothetical protein